MSCYAIHVGAAAEIRPLATCSGVVSSLFSRLLTKGNLQPALPSDLPACRCSGNNDENDTATCTVRACGVAHYDEPGTSPAR